MNKLRKIKNLKFQAQKAQCYYCCQPMWLENPARFAVEHGLTTGNARHLQATAEHLTARCDGGRNTPDNIVAACWFCNSHRHKSNRPMSPEAYAIKVRARLNSGRWHGLILCGANATDHPTQNRKMIAGNGPEQPSRTLPPSHHTRTA